VMRPFSSIISQHSCRQWHNWPWVDVRTPPLANQKHSNIYFGFSFLLVFCRLFLFCVFLNDFHVLL